MKNVKIISALLCAALLAGCANNAVETDASGNPVTETGTAS